MSTVFVRPRPLAASEASDAAIQYAFEDGSISVAGKRFANFAGVLAADNSSAYASAVQPLVPAMRAGTTACCFAYGHTNSGKTHTIFGYGDEEGVCQRAVRDLFAATSAELLVQMRFYELYNGKVYDLLNARQPGFVREDANGVFHVRSATTMGPNGEVLTQSLHAVYAGGAEALLTHIAQARGLRAEGTSELHEQSSRSHAVLELEVVTPELAQARQDAVVAESRVVPLGKARDDLYIAIQSKLYVQSADGSYVASGAVTSPEDEARLSELQAQVQQAEEVLAAAQTRVAELKAQCTGGALVFVDLAGAEYTGEGLARSSREMKEAKEINSSLLALKECVRRAAQASDARHIPFRNSKLTMVLRPFLLDHGRAAARTVMIASVSSAAAHQAKSLNTIKYAALVADAFKQS